MTDDSGTLPKDLSEFLPPYMTEVEELIAAARSGLITIESDARRGLSNVRMVREVFRAVHTIKGLSAMVDVGPLVDLAHAMETPLRTSDRAGGKLSSLAIDAYLKGLSSMEGMIRALSEGKPLDPASEVLLSRLQALVSAEEAPSPAPSDGLGLEPAIDGKLSAVDREQLLQGLATGRRAVRLDFAPSPAHAAAGLSITVVRERVAKVAEIIKVVPLSVPITPSEPGALVFVLLLLTRERDEAIAQTVGVPADRVKALTPHASAPPPVNNRVPDFEPIDDSMAEGSGRLGVVRVDGRRLDEAVEHMGSLVVNRNRMVRAISALSAQGVNVRELHHVLHENGRLLRDARAAVLRLRMVRVAEVLERLSLIVRGLRKTTGREVSLQLDVGQAEIDKSVGDRLFPAILHLVRNAVDHGIEAPEERLRRGKPAEGRVRIRCHEKSSSRLEISIEDDGQGILGEVIAAKCGVELPKNNDDLLALLCRPGFSTKEQVTTTSGRGMGMDIVRRIIVDQLGGDFSLQTTPGRGTTFTLGVPLTISILDAFIFESSTERYAAAVSSVDELFEVEPAHVIQAPSPNPHLQIQVGLVKRRDEVLPLVGLHSLLSPAGRRGASSGGNAKAMIVRHRHQTVALAVDRMLSQQEIVMRPLVDPLVQVQGVAGATDLGDGKPTLVLDLGALCAMSHREPRA